jgi:hypothetical protein
MQKGTRGTPMMIKKRLSRACRYVKEVDNETIKGYMNEGNVA